MYPKPRIEVLGREWEPVMICADSDELAAKGERAMLRFSSHAEPEFFVAPAGVVHAGWVVGIPRVSRPWTLHPYDDNRANRITKALG